MRELYVEGVAIHDGPESCAVAREGGGEALTGVRAGRAIEPRKNQGRGADAVYRGGRQHRPWRYTRATVGPRAVREPVHVLNLHAREPGDPTVARAADHGAGRSGKAEVASLR